MSHEFNKELLIWKKHLKNLDFKLLRLQETGKHLRKKIKKREGELKQKADLEKWRELAKPLEVLDDLSVS